jgi:hypothetical protein
LLLNIGSLKRGHPKIYLTDILEWMVFGATEKSLETEMFVWK